VCVCVCACVCVCVCVCACVCDSGADVSHEFAHTNGFEVLARAHQMVLRG